MNTRAKYTTQLQAGLGLVPETQKLLAVWRDGMDGQDLLKAALASGEFPTLAARRLRNIIIEAFCPRYLVDNAAPAKLLKSTQSEITREDFRSLCFIFTSRANAILADFIRKIYWPRYAAGRVSISKRDSLEFVSAAVLNARTTSRWSESTIIRVARYLLGACADFGLLGSTTGEDRPISNFRISSNVASILAHDLHFRGLGDNAILQSPDWSLFGLESDDVLAELRRLSLRRELILQSAAGVTHVAWKHKSMEELADAFAQS
jgi:hypothetical protein